MKTISLGLALYGTNIVTKSFKGTRIQVCVAFWNICEIFVTEWYTARLCVVHVQRYDRWYTPLCGPSEGYTADITPGNYACSLA